MTFRSVFKYVARIVCIFVLSEGDIYSYYLSMCQFKLPSSKTRWTRQRPGTRRQGPSKRVRICYQQWFKAHFRELMSSYLLFSSDTVKDFVSNITSRRRCIWLGTGFSKEKCVRRLKDERTSQSEFWTLRTLLVSRDFVVSGQTCIFRISYCSTCISSNW